MHVEESALTSELDIQRGAESIDSPAHAAQLAPVPTQRVGGENKALKICLLGYRSHPYGGGQGIYIKYLSKALVEAGHEVDVISGQPYPHVDPRVKLIKMPGLNLFENGLGSLRAHHLSSLTNILEWTIKLTGGFAEPYCFGRRVVKHLKKHGHQYDLIHDNQSLSYGMLALQKRMPLVTTLHHPITNDLKLALDASSSWHEKLLIRRWHAFLMMQKQVVQRLSNIVTVSARSQRDIAHAFDVRADGIKLVYNGIDTEEFAPLPNVQRRPLRLMATASADAPLKGLRYLLEAYAQLLPQYPQLELLVVGKPRPDGDTEKLMKKLAIIDRVQFVSSISTEEMVEYYAQASIAVVPSLYEGFGLPAGEAMACGLPVISTTGGALPEVVGDAGVLVPTADAGAIADAIADLLENPAKREALGLAGRQFILDNFCWKRVSQQMTDFYRGVLEV